jgi:hypothetical protein
LAARPAWPGSRLPVPGEHSGLSSWWTHHKEVAMAGKKGIAGPTDLSNGGTRFRTYLGL